MAQKPLLDSAAIQSIVNDLSRKVLDDIADSDRFAVVGIQSSGIILADRIIKYIENSTGKVLKHGKLDISFYRDDLATRGMLPIIKETLINFNINNLNVLLVDDVIFTGRTVKAAIETLMSFGRPASIKFFCLVDRGNRELPIQPDYCGITVKTVIRDMVNVYLHDNDVSKDEVVLVVT